MHNLITMIQSTNPTTGEVFATFDELTDEQLEQKVAVAQATYDLWHKLSFAERAKPMKKLAQLIRERSRELAELAAKEMGKPIAQGMAVNEKSAWVCDYYADNAEAMLAPEYFDTENKESFARFDSLGIILAVMPWNFPYWQVFRFIAPAAMAGNVGLLKHASNVPQCALAIEQLFDDAGFPKGVFQTTLIGSSKVEGLIKDDRIKAATLTGSEYAGSQVAMQAGHEIKKVVLELGGSDPFIVLEDANLDNVCAVSPMARLQNNGQSCIASKRFIVLESQADEFIERFKDSFEAMVIGDPLDEKTQIGPMVDEKSLQELDKQVQDSITQGAELVTGGKRVGDSGNFYAPTILSGVKPGMRAYHEEMFGPVASVIIVKDENEAIRVANDSRFGLGGSVWTQDLERGKRVAAQIESGAVFVNSMVKSDPRLPFGGIKKSGFGRELSHYGIKEFCNIKLVVVND